MKLLRGSLGITVALGAEEPYSPTLTPVYFRLTHKKLPTGGVMFAMSPDNAREFARKIVSAADGKTTLADVAAEESIARGETPEDPS